LKNNIDINKKTDEIIAELTLEEKIKLCSGASMWTTAEIKRLKIPVIVMSDGPHGLRYVVEINEFGATSNKRTTCFPTASALASSWNKDLLYKVGKTLAEEAKSLDVNIILGPGVNIKRSPLGGRNFEYFSEDPILTADLASSFVKGVQDQGVGTSLKHYVCNNQEYKRFSVNVEVAERALREIYLLAFERVVKEAEPWTVMAAYNRVNGTPATQNDYLLNQILRDEWGYQGLVISDWGAIHDRVAALKSGLDLEMPGPSRVNKDKIQRQLDKKELKEEILNKSVKRILKTVFKSSKEKINIDYDEHDKIAQSAAEESVVLLKNENELLPIDFNNLNSITVIGEMAVNPRYQGNGSSKVTPYILADGLSEIKSAIPPAVELYYASGYNNDQNLESQINEAINKATKSDYVIIFAGIPEKFESEGFDRKNIDLPESQNKLIKAVSEVNKNIIVVLNNGSAVNISAWIDKVPAVLEGWLPGQAGAKAIVNVIKGKVNPSGKLAETFPIVLEHNPSYLNFPGVNEKVNYAEGIYVGYRYYEKKKIEPQFPFGHGLSYTEFEYTNLSLDKEVWVEDEIEVKFELKNVGELAGKEIVQFYVSQNNPYYDRPRKELKKFKKVSLKSGESKELKFNLSYRDFAYFNPELKDWVVEEDEYKIIIASSAQDIRLSEAVKVKSKDIAHILSTDDPVLDWLAEPLGKKVLTEILSAEQMDYLENEENTYITERPLYRLDFLSDEMVSEQEIEKIRLNYSMLRGDYYSN
jgi:beta-glucosidase